MKLIAKLTKMKFPFKMTTDGVIKIDTAVFHLITTTQDVVTEFRVEFNLIIETDINGFKVDPFKSKISHTFSEEQFNEFMEHLNKQNP